MAIVEEGVGCQETVGKYELDIIVGADYRGTANTTIGGLTCQAWSVQEPHEHGRTLMIYRPVGIVKKKETRGPAD